MRIVASGASGIMAEGMQTSAKPHTVAKLSNFPEAELCPKTPMEQCASTVRSNGSAVPRDLITQSLTKKPSKLL